MLACCRGKLATVLTSSTTKELIWIAPRCDRRTPIYAALTRVMRTPVPRMCDFSGSNTLPAVASATRVTVRRRRCGEHAAVRFHSCISNSLPTRYRGANRAATRLALNAFAHDNTERFCQPPVSHAHNYQLFGANGVLSVLAPLVITTDGLHDEQGDGMI